MPKIMDEWQQSFGLSLLANCSSTCSVPVNAEHVEAAREKAQEKLTHIMQEKLAKYLDAYLNKHTPKENQWSIVWGPQVFTIGPTKPPQNNEYLFTSTNSMFVASNGIRDVVAIAATNSDSKFDWLVEDFTLSPGVHWEDATAFWKVIAELNQHWKYEQLKGKLNDVKPQSPAPEIPTIALGGAIGISILLGGMTDPKSGGLIAFLNQRSLPITVVGHSLGGALAPQLGLALIDPAIPLLHNIREVTVYATAGASPGNAAFANYYLQHLPVISALEPWQVWNGVLANQFDLVPAAFTEAAVTNWKKAMLLSGEFTFEIIGKYFKEDAKALLEIQAASEIVIKMGQAFAEKHGPLAHLGPDEKSVVLNPDAEPSLDFYWDFCGDIMTIRQAPKDLLPKRLPLTLGAQFDKQHIMAYEQIILSKYDFSNFSTGCDCN